MSRILAIKGTEGEKEIDYSSLSLKEIERRIQSYEKKLVNFQSSCAVTTASPVRPRITLPWSIGNAFISCAFPRAVGWRAVRLRPWL